MSKSVVKKRDQLGMHPATAAHKLKKKIMFSMMCVLGLDTCWQCGKKIETVDDLSVEHKIPWLDSDDPVGLYFDLNNIAFSHLSCNSGSARKKRGTKAKHGTRTRYTFGCRCQECKDAASAYYHTEERKKHRREYMRKRYHSDPEFRQYFLDKATNRRRSLNG